MKNYKSSDELINALMSFEKREGLDGAFILIHPGTEDSRKDKLYDRLGSIISDLCEKGYRFDRL
jgi:aromatic ring-cleaving dioxygenase